MFSIAEGYDHRSVEQKWQEKWSSAGLGDAEPDPQKEKFYLVFAYPNPSGFLHTGHTRGFSYSDIVARYKRMKGFNVLFPYGVHATGNLVMGASKKARESREWQQMLLKGGVSEGDIKRMGEDPAFVADYFLKNYGRQFGSFGFLMDHRRALSTIDRGYNRFIQWQFRKLHQKGLLRQGEYFATFCVNCGPVAVDPAEMEISKGGNAEKNEYTLLKFRYGDDYIIAATLRPETVYGQTNMWADPDVTYVRAKVGGETWIVSRECAEKLGHQKGNVTVLGEIKGAGLMGKKCLAPKVGREIPILPSHFCDPKVGTGLVTCVPSDAPYDYIALEDLKKNTAEQQKYGLKPEDVNLEAIRIIRSPKYGDFAAKRACGEFGIANQHDAEKLEAATQAVYKDGFHAGRLTELCGPYAGKSVAEAKDLMKGELISGNEADIMYDLSEEVVCRCGSPVVIKRVNDQWFIRYSDHSLTETSKAHAETMDVYPDEYKGNICNVLDWFQDRACTRLGNLMGTRFPLDEKWTIEPIADSTLYPMYYTISKYVNDGSVKPEEMDEAWFDYVFLGEGRARNGAHENARREFDYWYPLDLNVGGKEHKTVHFPVFLMNHVGVLRQKDWPGGIFVNWWVTAAEGAKLSKSQGGGKGGVEAVPDAADKYSVDAMRLYYSHIASPFVDMAWEPENIMSYRNQVRRIYSTVSEMMRLNSGESPMDAWLRSRAMRRVIEVEAAMGKLDLKKAVDSGLFGMMSDLQWYRKRKGGNRQAVRMALETWLRLMAPFAPHVCEECWHMLGNGTFVSAENYPLADAGQIDDASEQSENVVMGLASDIENVIKLTKSEPRQITVFIAPDWKRNLYSRAASIKNPHQLIGEAMKDAEVRKKGKEAANFVNWLGRHSHELQPSAISAEAEKTAIESSAPYLEGLFSARINVAMADLSQNEKARSAVPMKPAIYLE